MITPTNARPLGLSLLAVAIGWGAFAALIFALFAPSAAMGVSWNPIRLAAAAYAVLGILTVVALWRRAPWARTVFDLWTLTALAAGAMPSLILPATEPAGRLLAIPAALLVGGVLLLLRIYVRRHVPAAA